LILNSIPVIGLEEMFEISRIMFNCYGISILQVLENAGRNLADLTNKILDDSLYEKKICIVVGGGNNGAGGLVAARHLSNRGAEVTCYVVSSADNFRPLAVQQLEIVRHLPISVTCARSQACYYTDWEKFDLVIDAICGYKISKNPSSFIIKTIQKINELNCPTIAFDAPSGLHLSKGYISHQTIQADVTLTLALPKAGLLHPNSRQFVGNLYIADISVPPLLYCQLGLEVNPRLFEKNPIIPYFNSS
jgi:NAD(P)H-hydrate epimerase